jgi:hypothetical protein
MHKNQAIEQLSYRGFSWNECAMCIAWRAAPLHQDTNLWAHRLVLGSVSPFLRVLLADFERRGDDVITIFLPLIKGYHMKLVLDYIYSGSMYLCGAHMQYVIQVMEVLQLKCGVSVNKMVKATEESLDPEKQWIEIEHSTMHLKEYDSDPDTHKGEDDLETDMNMKHMAQNGDLKGLDSDTINNATCNEHSQANVNILAPTPSKSLDSSGQCDVKMPIPQRPIGGDEESDDDNDVVMVELDEDFVVERVEEQASHDGSMAEVVGELTAPNHRYLQLLSIVFSLNAYRVAVSISAPQVRSLWPHLQPLRQPAGASHWPPGCGGQVTPLQRLPEELQEQERIGPPHALSQVCKNAWQVQNQQI